MKNAWEIAPGLCRAVVETHREAGMMGGGHGIDHVITVAQFAPMVTPDGEDEVAYLATLAALCHNADRVLQKQLDVGRRDVPDGAVRKLVGDWLASTPISSNKLDRVFHAVMLHCAKTQKDEDLAVTALRDADRLANIQADVIVRSGQHYEGYPAVHPIHLAERTPDGTYFEPGSVAADLWYMSTRWDFEHPQYDPEFGIVLPKARELARPHLAFLRDYVVRCIEARRQTGLVPYPEFLR